MTACLIFRSVSGKVLYMECYSQYDDLTDKEHDRLLKRMKQIELQILEQCFMSWSIK